MLKWKYSIQIPNYITALSGFAMLTIITGLIQLEYLLPVLALAYFLIVQKGMIRNKTNKAIFLLFAGFVFLQIIGLIGNFTVYSLKNILSSGCAFLLICTVSDCRIRVQGYIKLLYILVCLTCALAMTSHKGNDSQNTVAGYYLFFTLTLIVLLVHKKGLGDRTKSFKIAMVLSCSLLPSMVFAWIYAARTAFFVNLMVIFFYFLFYFLDLKDKTYKWLFVVILVLVFVGLTIYINASKYSWYGTYNILSVKYFGKNIDSSRSYLWMTSLSELKGMKLIFGLGTGTTPSMGRYAGSSFHNSFIQTVMQNGIWGLTCLIVIFYLIWEKLTQINARSLRALFLSAFIAVVAYNCMECCLLQNKTFLGMLQWILLAIGLNYSAKDKKMCNQVDSYS